MEMPSKQQIKNIIYNFDIAEMGRYTSALHAEKALWQRDFAGKTGILPADMPIGKRIRLCLESMFIEPLSPMIKAHIERENLMMRWALSAVSSVVQLSNQSTEGFVESDFVAVNPARAFDILGQAIAKDVLNDYLLALAKHIKAIQVHFQTTVDTFYPTLVQLKHNPSLRAENTPLAALDDETLLACLLFAWLNEISAITNSFAGELVGHRYRLDFEDDASEESESQSSEELELAQLYLNSSIRHMIASGFGTTFQSAGRYAEILFEASSAFDLSLEAIMDDATIFERISQLLLKQASMNLDASLEYEDWIHYYKTDYSRPDTYRLKSILRMAESLADFNYLAKLQDLHQLEVFSPAELQHAQEKILEKIQHSVEFQTACRVFSTASKGDLQVIHACLAILDTWLDVLNQSYMVFNRYLVQKTNVDFKNSELCPQMQLTIGDERGIQYFYRHILLPAMKRVFVFAQLNNLKANL